MLLSIFSGSRAEQLDKLPGKIIAVTETDAKGDFSHRVLVPTQQRGAAIHAQLNQVGNR